MTGAELAVGGWFASAVIGKVVNKAVDYLCDNNDLHKQTNNMLNNLKKRLIEMKAVLELIEKHQIQNNSLIEWLKLIKDAAYEAEDVLDDFEAKKIRDDLNRKSKVSKAVSSIKGAKNFILPNKDVEKLKQAVTNLEEICKGFITLFWSLKLDLDTKGKGLVRTECGNTTKISPHEPVFGNDTRMLPHDRPLFGRDTEIKSILSLILGYEIESLESETKSEEMANVIESNEGDGIGNEIESVGRETISEVDENLVRAGNKSDIGVAQKMLGTDVIRDKFSKSFRTVEGDVGGASGEQTTTTSGTKNIEPSSSQDKAQKLLLDKDQTQRRDQYGRPFVIPIVGMSGVGKTALAQTIYGHPFLQGHFDLERYFYVPQEFDVNKIVEEFKPFLHDEKDPMRFFLVIEDVSDGACSLLLKMIKYFFSSGAFGSVILVTTQEHNVANKLHIFHPMIVPLHPLERNYFLLLLEHHAFENAKITNEKREALRSTCQYIGRRLPPIPLVARTIGRLLNSDINEDKWECISRIHWKTLDDGSIIPILDNCYRDLNAKLKLCFAFCSIFPTNYIIERDRTILMWIGNNFVVPNFNDDYSKLEDIGRMWFDELVSRSLLLPTPWPGKYIMHNEIRELALAAFSEDGFVFKQDRNPCPEGCFLLEEHSDPCIHGYSDIRNDPRKIPKTTRHLTLIKGDLNYIIGIRCYDKLRTLLFHGDYFVKPDKNSVCMLSETKNLRVLELSYPGEGIKWQVKDVGNLPHLRYLDLSYTAIEKLPESICSLCHLQVLNLRGCRIIEIPKNMNQLINLRHLYASNETISLISGIGKLTNLQELEEFRVIDEEGHTIGELAELKEIRGHLRIVNLEKIKDEAEAQEARMPEKKDLKALSLIWRDKDYSDYSWLSSGRPTWPKEEGILNSLKPHSYLVKLEIINYLGSKLPSWITALVNIRYIYLRCYAVVTLLPLGELPSLHTLHLESLDTRSVGAEFYGAKQKQEIFPSLKNLKFVNMWNWTVWSTAEGRRELFPCLEVLQIEKCGSLIEIPLTSMELSNLRELELSSCYKIINGGGIFQKRLPMLTSLKLSSIRDVTIPVDHVPNLKTLSIKYADKICFEGDAQSLSNLKTLHSSVLVDVSLPSLKVLELYAGFAWRYETYDLEQWFMKLSGLVELTIHCDGLKELPSNFADLVSLRTLTLKFFQRKYSLLLPEGGMPPNLKELCIRGASNELVKQCRKKGEYWGKIAYIPYIRFNEQTLQML